MKICALITFSLASNLLGTSSFSISNLSKAIINNALCNNLVLVTKPSTIMLGILNQLLTGSARSELVLIQLFCTGICIKETTYAQTFAECE